MSEVPAGSARLALGPLPVRVEPDRAAALGAATRSPDAGVPATFPIVWLSQPAIRDALMGLLAPGELPFHEEQAFDYASPLESGIGYSLFVDLARDEEPARIVLSARAEAANGQTVMTAKTVLRLLRPVARQMQPVPAKALA